MSPLVLGWIAIAVIGGGLYGGLSGLLVGGGIGWLIGSLIDSLFKQELRGLFRKDLDPFEARIADLERQVANLREQLKPAAPAARQAAPSETKTTKEIPPAVPQPVAEPAPMQESRAEAPSPRRAESEDRWLSKEEARPASPELPGFVHRLVGFFTGGNPVVRVGMVVLFFGVAFLVRYAAERDLVPIELRLAGIAAAAVGVLFVGWRLRERPGHYGLVLQGGAIGVLYLTVYAAAKLYQLMPMGLAFGLMVGFVAFSALLAVLQDARILAMFGSAGGFLAPILASTGGGSHVVLFSYYSLLNVGILAIAWFRAWRELNVLGFLFTFVIGSVWGYEYYRPEHFWTTEPFLILFFIIFVAIAVLFATRQPPKLRGYVDGSLVFGVPLVAFALQSALVRDFEDGLTISALVAAAFYIGLATLLWRRSAEGLRMLTEAFLALGVVFGSLAIPLALDGRWTAVAWAMEGAALVWVGVRQARLLARLFGVFLQIAAGVAFFFAIDAPAGGLPLWNGVWLGSAVVSLAGLFSSWYLYRHADGLRPRERQAILPLLAWGLAWWLGAGAREMNVHLDVLDQPHGAVTFLSLTALALAWLGQRLRWPAAACATAPLLPLLVLLFFAEMGPLHIGHAFERWGLLAWALAMATHLRLLWRNAEVWPALVTRLWHPMGLWLLVGLLTWELDWAIGKADLGPVTWRLIPWALLPGVAVMLLLRWGKRITWPIAKYEEPYLMVGLGALASYLWLWALAANYWPGDTAPLAYVTLLNPLDLVQFFALLVALRWALWWRKAESSGERLSYLPFVYGAIGAGGFLWLNAVVARAVHFWGAVPWDLKALLQSVVFHAALSVLWTTTALAVMVLARRLMSRQTWIVGAGLLGVVVVKLFVVDLEGSGTLGRIVSFLAVGGLMLLIGYFSPLPPGHKEETGA